MRYFALSLGLSLRMRLRKGRFWLALLLVLAGGFAVRWTASGPQPDAAAVRAGVVLPDGGEAFWEALEGRGGSLVRFIRTDEATARAKVASSQWDCALLLPGDFAERLESGETEALISLLTGPGSTVYPLIREAAAAALLELSSAKLAADYLLSSGIAGEAASLREISPRLEEALPDAQRVRVEMETLTGRPLSGLSLAGDGLSRVLRGVLAAALLVWALFAAVDLGRWKQSGPARRMEPCQGGLLLGLPHLTAALLPAFLLGAGGTAAAGGTAGCMPALAAYLAALEGLALLLAAFRPVWTALPAAAPFAAASVFVLSPVFVDAALFFPRLAPLIRWLPATLFLRGCEGDGSALALLLAQAAAFLAACAAQEAARRRISVKR